MRFAVINSRIPMEYKWVNSINRVEINKSENQFRSHRVVNNNHHNIHQIIVITKVLHLRNAINTGYTMINQNFHIDSRVDNRIKSSIFDEYL